MKFLTAALLTLLAAASANAQAPSGRQTYDTRCARCHGGDATGGESGPNIVQKIDERDDATLAAFLRVGRPASGMPAFDLPADDMTALVAYLRTLVPFSRGARPAVVRRSVTTADGRTLDGRVLNEGLVDLQLRTDDNRIHLLRKAGERYREVTSQRDWPTYHGDVSGNRYTTVTQIDKANVARLAPRWVFPLPNVTAIVETTPVVVDGVMYVTSANEVWALDAGVGRQLWHYQRPRTAGLAGNAAQGFNRGVAVSGDRLFMATDNAHLIALDRRTGDLLWDTPMADWRQNYNATAAPLVAGTLVISGSAGGDEGVRGFVAAFDVATGKEAWRVWTVPNPGEPGSETWQGPQTEHRGGASWMTGTYDPQLGLVYWPVGNPGLDYFGNDRQGDNLYSDSILALDAKTGVMRWYFQFTPHDVHDWDAQEPPVLVDTTWQGQPRKLLIQANRNGFFYVLDRTNGQFLLGKPFLKKLTWAKGLDAKGRPMLNDLNEDANGETYVCPGFQGGANWYSTSFNPATGLYYFQALERCNLFAPRRMEWQAGKGFMGGSARPAPGEGFTKSVRAIDVRTGNVAWDLVQGPGPVTASAGLLSTASGLVFFGENSGSFAAADASTGTLLWSFPTNQVWKASPMTYVFDGRQYIAVAVGQSIMAFGLP
ncbi:MAG TPA: PQQ-binding-like beta-propeller repeat protein [Vicinamibacterales bacterium]|nr:PQQ-binding-like beta-propeller repeat protein [Vicinamibacterales bacterium]